jgi:hypothetical protein
MKRRGGDSKDSLATDSNIKNETIYERIKEARQYSRALREQLEYETLFLTAEEHKQINKDVTSELDLTADQQYLYTLWLIRLTHYWPDNLLETLISEKKDAPKLLSRLYAIDDTTGKTFQFQKHLSPGSRRQAVFLAIDTVTKRPWVVKWVLETLGASMDIRDEMKVLQRVRNEGVRTAEPIFTAKFWGNPVLLTEYLVPLDTTDSEFNVGKQLLGDLQKLHRIGVFNDLKPDNVMKRIKPNKSEPDYLLIDFGGMAIKQKAFGYERFTWTPSWAWQPYEYGQVTTGKYDLLELGGLMRGLEAIRKNQQVDSLQEYVHTFPTQHSLYPFMEAIRAVPENAVVGNSKLYKQLHDILAAH